MFAFGIVSLGALLASTAAHAALFGVQPLSGRIVIVNPATGTTSILASPAGLDANDTRIGLSGAEAGAVLIYSNDDDGTDNDLQRYSPISGALISSHSTAAYATDGLTYQSGTIFSSHMSADVHKQAGYGGSETFFATSTPSPPLGGLGGDDNGRSWESDTDGMIRESNATTGAILNTFTAPAGTQGLAYDGQLLYASNATGLLFTLNANTGAVLNTVTVVGGPLYGLGSANIPEPATVALLLMAIVTMISFARRTKIRSSVCRQMLMVGIATLGALFASTAAHAALFGVQPNTSRIVIVNPAIGTTTPFITPAGLAPAHTIIGLSGAEGGSVLIYTNDNDGGTTDLRRYSATTGALLSTATTSTWSHDGLTYQGGTIFLNHSNADVHKQVGYSATETFNATTSPSSTIGALGGDDNGRLWQNCIDGQIREFNLAGTILNSFAAPSSGVQGLAFDGQLLYASNGAGLLYTLNANTGAVLNTVTVVGGPLYGLGSANVPEPATMALLVSAIMGTMLIARRRVRG
jgi:hypothetical protein